VGGTCVCNDGFKGDGTTCEADVDDSVDCTVLDQFLRAQNYYADPDSLLIPPGASRRKCCGLGVNDWYNPTTPPNDPEGAIHQIWVECDENPDPTQRRITSCSSKFQSS
jgi:hypothetical protein